MGVLQTLLLGILASAVVAVFFEFRKKDWIVIGFRFITSHLNYTFKKTLATLE